MRCGVTIFLVYGETVLYLNGCVRTLAFMISSPTGPRCPNLGVKLLVFVPVNVLIAAT